MAKEKTIECIWSKLENLYMSGSLHNRLHLKKSLFSFRMGTSKSMNDHLNEFSQLVNELLDMKVTLDNEDKVFILLNILSNKYDFLVTKNVHGKETINYDDVREALLKHKTWMSLFGSSSNLKGEGFLCAAKKRIKQRVCNSRCQSLKMRIMENASIFKTKGTIKSMFIPKE